MMKLEHNREKLNIFNASVLHLTAAQQRLAANVAEMRKNNELKEESFAEETRTFHETMVQTDFW